MEIDLLKENWPTMDLLENPNTQKTSTTEEDNSVFSIWEENYQDLSDWCIDKFQGRCAFPIGEFETNEYSGTKSEDNGISIKKTEAIGKVSRDLLVDQQGLEVSSLKIPELALVKTETGNQKGDLQLAIKSEIIEERSIEMNDILLLNPIDSSINQRTDNWIQLANVNLPNVSTISAHNKSINHKNNSNLIIAEYPSLKPREIDKDEKDDWDTINTFDSTESETFDLLSYLCDDNIQSPDGSVISRDSGPTIKSNLSITSHVDDTSSSSSTTRDPRKARRSDVPQRDYIEANTSSTSSSIAAISAALDSVAKMSKRSSKDGQKRNSRSLKNEYEANGGESRGKKRCIDSDSEDRGSDGSYRESREKNNEASRKSRQNKKAKENEMMARASELERDNRILRMKVDELDKLVTTMRTAILRSALKKSP